MNAIKTIFKAPKPLIGVIHTLPLPGTPLYQNDQLILNHAIEEALIYKNAGIDGLIIENMHDVPYLRRRVGPEITAFMSVIAFEVKNQTQLPCGVQVLAGANESALAVAKAAGLDFIRAEGFVFAHTADEGHMDADAGSLLRYRKQIGAEHIAVFTDIKKKHSSHAITSDVDLIETAKAAAFFRSDGLIITGVATGQPASFEELRAVKQSCELPVLVGSGINFENVKAYLEVSDALIIGSWFKKDGHWANALDPERVKELVNVSRDFISGR